AHRYWPGGSRCHLVRVVDGEEHADAFAGEVGVAGVDVDAGGCPAAAYGDGEGGAGAGERVENMAGSPCAVPAIRPADGHMLSRSDIGTGRLVKHRAAAGDAVAGTSLVEIADGCACRGVSLSPFDDAPARLAAGGADAAGAHGFDRPDAQLFRVDGVVGALIAADWDLPPVERRRTGGMADDALPVGSERA